jgi:hypothetical protein
VREESCISNEFSVGRSRACRAVASIPEMKVPQLSTEEINWIYDGGLYLSRPPAHVQLPPKFSVYPCRFLNVDNQTLARHRVRNRLPMTTHSHTIECVELRRESCRLPFCLGSVISWRSCRDVCSEWIRLARFERRG